MHPHSQLANIKYQLNDIDNKLIDEIIYGFETIIPWLQKYQLLFKGVGSKLQYVEDEIALKMFQWVIDEQIPLINVHDAFAVSSLKGAIISNAMHEFRDEAIRELGFLPHYF